MRIGKRRIEWKPWNWSTRTWIVALILLIAISPFVTRWCCLWQVPDLPLPFDKKEFIGEEISDELNAFRYYEAAAGILKRIEPSWLDVALQTPMEIRCLSGRVFAVFDDPSGASSE